MDSCPSGDGDSWRAPAPPCAGRCRWGKWRGPGPPPASRVTLLPPSGGGGGSSKFMEHLTVAIEASCADVQINKLLQQRTYEDDDV